MMKARVYRLTTMLLIIFNAMISTTESVTECGECFDWQYCRQEDATCVDCHRCGDGEGAITLCSKFNNTVCEPCRDGMYSALSVVHYAYLCYPCTKCGPDRDTIANCTAETDTTCGPCPRKKFAYDNGTCLECSQCPEDPSVPATRYAECAVNGAPRNFMCIAGVCNDCGEHDITVNKSEGGFVTYKPDEVNFDRENKPTAQDMTAVAAVSITVAVIVGLLVIFVGAFCLWLLYGAFRRRRGNWLITVRQCQSRTNERSRNDDDSGVHLMQAEEIAESTSSSTMVYPDSATTQFEEIMRRPGPSLKLLEAIGFDKEIEHKWCSFAEVLGMSKDLIAEVDHACQSNTSKCCRKMLDKLFSRADSVKWSDVVKACNRNFLHSVAIKLELFFIDDVIFTKSDVVLWDYLVYQIKLQIQKPPIIPKWRSQFNKLLQLDVTMQGQAYALEDAIMVLTSKESPQAIVLHGEAGTGKTTIALRLVQNWCMIGSSSRFALVIYIDVTRTDVGKITNLASLISLHLKKPVDPEMVGSMCKILEKLQGKGLLVILDGYDEVQDDGFKSFIEDSLYPSLLPKASLLLICKRSYSTRVSIKMPLLHYSQIERFIQDTVGRRGIAMLQSSPIWPMMHNLLLLNIACLLIYHGIEVTRLSTLTQLYNTLVIKLIADEVKTVSHPGKDHSALVRFLLNTCAKASYESVLQCRNFITSDTNMDSIVESGLLMKHENTFYFTHHTFKEFFTAYHLALSFSNFDHRHLKLMPSNSLLFPLLSGLTGKMIFKIEETNNNSLIVVSMCYVEAKHPVSGEYHPTTVPIYSLVLNNYKVTPYHCRCLETFMQDCKVRELNMHALTSAVESISNTTGNESHNQKDMGDISSYKNVNAYTINITRADIEYLSIIINTMKTNTSLVSLNLSDNTTIADDDIVAEISAALTVNNHLQTLKLYHCGLTSSHANKVIESLLSNSCLLQLDLSNNLIELLNIKVITGVLQRGIIQEINIGNNLITEVESELTEIAHQDQRIKYICSQRLADKL